MKKQFQTLISAKDLFDIVSDEHVIVLDCRFYLDDLLRGRKEFLQNHISTACYMDLTHDLSGPVIKGMTGRHPLPHPDILVQTFRNAGIGQDSLVIAYDQGNGAYASRAWWLLRWLGHQNVAILDGGFPAWVSISGHTDNQWPLPKEGNLTANIQEQFVTGMDKVLNPHHALVDSRDYKRYSGEIEPIDPVAGHIPGAICMPYMENTNEKGLWKDPLVLKNRFSELENMNTDPVFYCGSGVTACHNILAYKIATGKDARLYPGSWSEWINYHKSSS